MDANEEVLVAHPPGSLYWNATCGIGTAVRDGAFAITKGVWPFSLDTLCDCACRNDSMKIGVHVTPRKSGILDGHSAGGYRNAHFAKVLVVIAS